MAKSNQKISKLLVVCIITLFICGMIFIFLLIPSGGQGADKKNILIISKGNDTHFIQSLQIDQNNFEISIVSDSTQITSIDSVVDVVVIFDASLESSEIALIGNFVDNGGACIIFMGQNLHNNATLLENLQLIADIQFEKNTESMLFIIGDITHPISQYIDWNSAPDMNVGNMSIIPTQDFNSSIERIIDVYPASKNLEIDLYQQPILVEMTKGEGNILLFTGWVEEGTNIHFVLWPYFNYLLYTMAFESLNEQYLTFSQWPYSPVPHLVEQIILLIVIVILAILAASLFLIVKKKSGALIDQATIEAMKRQAEEEERKRREEEEELKRKIEVEIDVKDDWEVIGIHRQLGGFLFTLFIGLILVIPQLLISNFLMPQIIQPYPQAAGWYYYAYNVFQVAWLLFDFGTSYALAKYFAQHRVKNPEKAIHYIQIFVWWQLFTGLIQVSIFAFIGSIIFPQTNIAHMSWVFITFSLVQYPGFFLVFMYSFQGMQKADLHLITYVAWEVIWQLIGQMLFCYLGRLWGANNPMFGEALGAGIGYSIARYFDYWATFFLSMLLFKKMGYSPKTIFRIDFTKEEFKESMKYGSRLAFGESFVQLGWFIQIIVTSAFIANYSNELGYFNLTWIIGLMVLIISLYGQSLLGAYSESQSHGKTTLTKFYVYQGFRWGNYFGFFIISVLLATGAKFIVGAAGAEYGTPAVKYLVPLMIFHIFGLYSWLGDSVFQGTGKTGLLAITWIVEQTLRALLIIILVIWLKDMIAVLFAYIPAVLIKDILLWLIIRYKITEYKIYPFKTFITPAIAAIINYIVLFLVGEFFWSIDLGDKILNTAIIFLIGIFLFMYFFAFVEGLLGGYDDNTLKEFERAANLVGGPIGVFPKALYKAAHLGAKLSPLHNKFKIGIYEQAMEEAYELTLEKKVLKI